MTMTARKIRRNDIVVYKHDPGFWAPYGRVNRVIDEGHVEVIDCGKYIRILPVEDLEVHNFYRGYWDTAGVLREKFPVFRRMVSLRKLKQMTSNYNDQVWKRKRKKGKK